MKIIKVIVSVLLLSSMATAIYFFVTYSDPPRKWWGNEVTINQVEDEYTKEVEFRIARCRKEGFLRYDSKTDSFRNATKEEINEFIEELQGQKILDSPHWIKLKSLYEKGDKIFKFRALPLSGTFGYILVRNNEVIFKYEMGIQ